MIIQIYAFTRLNEVLEAVAAGVDHIGFVAGDYGIVHGELDFMAAAALAREISHPVKSIALTMATEVDEILRMADAVRPDIVHVSTETNTVGIKSMAELHARLNPDIKLMKAIGVMDRTSIDDAMQYAAVSDILLLDTKIKHMPGVGATGQTHDWSISHEIALRSSVPVILAGGLSFENVIQAIHSVNPWGVDSNTSTNRSGSPYLKDIERIRTFVNAVRTLQTGEPGEKS
jgi:phosphoribosylanthranilate isomerase